MGNCFTKTGPPIQKDKVVSSKRNTPQPVANAGVGKSKLIGKADMMGIKRSDSIENFYEIEGMLGKGAFGEVVRARHLFSNDYRAIKIIEKSRIKKHRILM